MREDSKKMKKILKIENLDCANCAAKIEKSISEIGGVNSCSVSFLTGRLVIEADEVKMSEIIAAAEKAAKKVVSKAKIIVA